MKMLINKFLTLILISHIFSDSSLTQAQIIGSSVVTSVSVVISGEESTTTTPTPPLKIEKTDKPLISILPKILNSPESDSPVLSVIATLKSIVEKEQKKHDETEAKNKFKTEEVADDEAEDQIVTTTKSKIVSTDFPSAPALVPSFENEAENDTATSAEVHEAIHRISGALLKPGKKTTKPIENILTDVLTSINEGRNATNSTTISIKTTEKTTTPMPKKIKTNATGSQTVEPSNSAGNNKNSTVNNRNSNKVSETSSGMTSKNGNKAPVTPSVMTSKNGNIGPETSSGAMNKNSVRATEAPMMKKTTLMSGSSSSTTTKISPTPVNMIKVRVTAAVPSPDGMNGQEIGEKVVMSSTTNKFDEGSKEMETEEDMSISGGSLFSTSPAKSTPKPTQAPVKTVKNPIKYMGGSKKNTTSSQNRPTDFYDDEIFGYDPYQTFLHGVYVPIVEDEAGTTTKAVHESGTYYTSSNSRPQPMSNNRNKETFDPSSPTLAPKPRKPMPILPDHLHRPRPSHLQYQHSAAENIDPISGLNSIKVPHAGEKYGDDEDNLGPDRLTLISKNTLPPHIVQNLTAHHHAAHHSHSHSHDHENHNGDHSHDHSHDHHDHHSHHHHSSHSEKSPTFKKAPLGNPGLEGTITTLDSDMKSFVDLNNRLALRLFSSVTNPVSKSGNNYGNMVISPFTIISSLAMLFLGARASTAAQFDSLLNLDDQLSFNPHMIYYNITQSFLSQSNTAAAIIRLLIADKEKGDVLEFFRTRVQHFYDTRVEEADYKYAGHLAQSIINQMIRAQIQRHSYEMLNSSLQLQGPLSLLTAAFFDGTFGGSRMSNVHEMNFIHLASLGRRLIQIPAVAFYGSHRATYDEELDVTGVEIPYSTRDLSLLLLMPGKAGEFAIGGISSLKSRLTIESWTSLMRSFYARDPFKVVFPRFRAHTATNLTHTIQRFGLTDMFRENLAKFKGINGLNDLYMDGNLVHFAEMSTWEKLSDTHDEAQNGEKGDNKKFDLVRILRPHVREHYGNYGEPLSINDWLFKSRTPALLAPRKSEQKLQPITYTRVRSSRQQGGDGESEEKTLKFERPFMYVLRHNPTGMILMMGQYTDPITSSKGDRK